MLSLSAMAHAGATITIVNQNAAGVGFNDTTPATPVGGNSGTTIGAQRLIAFQFAANIWGAALDSTVEIRVHAKFEAQSCTATSGTLGSAGANNIISDFPNAEFASTWYHVALANKRAGSDQIPAGHDINATFNSSIGTPGCLENSTGWYYGLDTNNPPDKINLVTVVLHELGHGLGFSQFASTTTGAQPSNLTDVYGRRLFDLTQNKFWYEMTDAERVQSAINSRRVVWTGPAVTAAAAGVLAAGTPLLRIQSPPSIAGAYAVGDASFGAAITATPVSGQLVLATDDANETGPTTTDACTTITNPSAINGKIAVVDRGVCTFVVKAQNVQTAGAIAMVVVDNVAGSPPPGLGGSATGITIPAVRITLADGNTIKAQLGNTVTGFVALDMNVRAGADDAGRLIMNAPNPVQPGSSISHWDPITSPSQLMEPNANDDLTHSV
ncbi:MAG: PA domain-containing protein, partial [Terriglobales bacterium]